MGEAVTGFGRRLTDFVSRGLEPVEREAVLGDLTESTASGAEKLRDVLGLVVRRQAALWWDWRPWVVVTALVAQMGQMLAINTAALSRTYDLYFWIVRNYYAIDPATLHENNLSLQRGISRAALESFLLASSAWGTGFTLASLSPRTIWVNSTLFCLALLVSQIQFVTGLHVGIFPPVVLAAFVVAPSAWGIARGYRVTARPGLLAIIWGPLYISAFATQIGLTWPRPLPLGGWRMFVFHTHWPVLYAIAVLYWRRWRTPAISI